MTRPNVHEISRTMQSTEHDTFLDDVPASRESPADGRSVRSFDHASRGFASIGAGARKRSIDGAS